MQIEKHIYQDFHDQRCNDRRHRKIYFHLQIHLALREVNTLDSSVAAAMPFVSQAEMEIRCDSSPSVRRSI